VRNRIEAEAAEIRRLKLEEEAEAERIKIEAAEVERDRIEA
jgi:hypothetical protein